MSAAPEACRAGATDVADDTADGAVAQLLARCHRLGSDPRNTNYAGGNASAKADVADPATGEAARIMYVKGSGGDLGTLTESGLAALEVSRVTGLVGVYRGPEHEDEMVGLFDYCLFGRGGAAPSIDTAMHALVDSMHVDHLHPDSIIALATAVDGPELTKRCFGDEVLWVDWRRPGFQLGLDIAALHAANPAAIGCVLGGHGLTTWGATSDECEQRSLSVIRRAEAFIAEHGRPDPFGDVVDRWQPLALVERRKRAGELAPLLRGLASTDAPMIGRFTDSEVVLDFISRTQMPRLAALGTSCPDHFLRTKVAPMVADITTVSDSDAVETSVREIHAHYRDSYTAYYARHAEPDSPAMRGADPAIVLVPGIGMFSYGKDAQTARVASEFYVNAINVMRGAESLSEYRPIGEREKFRIEYWDLEEAKLQRQPKPKPLATRVALVTGAGSGIGRAIALRLAEEGACVVIADLDEATASSVAAEIGNTDRAISVSMDVTSAEQVTAAFAEAALAFGGVDLVVNNAGLSISKPLLETTEHDWDMQHDVMAKGSFLVSREAARIMIQQGLGGDIIYISSKNGVFAGPSNIAYGAAKADQAHQVRLLAAELGEFGIRVNGINPDGVVRGSGIFAKGWGAQRAAVYGVAEEDLGAFYAKRTLLKREVLPEHVAAAVFALTGGDLSLTTGLHIPVDAGVAAAFLR
jgi:rhamnulose-1-phosphate aldolase/alcohol dehydrogenase